MSVYDTNIQRIVNALKAVFLKKSDIVNSLTSSDSTKVLSAAQGKALADMIGEAIAYINK